MKIDLSLEGSWTLSGPRGIMIPARVPGCVHADLRRADLIPDPYFRDNEARLMWVGESEWTYERTFTIGKEALERDSVELRCAGLDTFADIELNGESLGRANNMFRQWSFEVKDRLAEGENRIVVRFESPMHRKMQSERFLWHTGIGHHRQSGGNWIRKEQSNFGGDWGPILVTAGIWRTIGIHAFDTVKIEDLRVRPSPKVKLSVAAVRVPLRVRSLYDTFKE